MKRILLVILTIFVLQAEVFASDAGSSCSGSRKRAREEPSQAGISQC